MSCRRFRPCSYRSESMEVGHEGGTARRMDTTKLILSIAKRF